MVCGAGAGCDRANALANGAPSKTRFTGYAAAREGLPPRRAFKEEEEAARRRQSASPCGGLRPQSRAQKRNVSGQSTPPTSTIRK